jgi:hypothetical protein
MTWVCAGCGSPPTGPLEERLGLARGECASCERSKIFVTRDASVAVTLSPEELAAAQSRAARVVRMDTRAGWRVKFDTGHETRLGINERGFGAEIAASRATGLAWNDAYLNTSTYRGNKPPDIGARVEVRNALSRVGELWCRSDERRDFVYLLVTGGLPSFRVVGWLEGDDLKVHSRWRTPPAVKYAGYFASQADLHTLPLPVDA